MTSYTLLYTRRALKDIRGLDVVVQKRVGKAIERLALKPLEHAEKLLDPHLGGYRWRVGDHRIIFNLDDKTIVVLRVGHRSDIYR